MIIPDIPEIYEILKRNEGDPKKYSVYLKDNLPAEYEYGKSDRVAPIIIVAEKVILFFIGNLLYNIGF